MSAPMGDPPKYDPSCPPPPQAGYLAGPGQPPPPYGYPPPGQPGVYPPAPYPPHPGPYPPGYGGIGYPAGPPTTNTTVVMTQPVIGPRPGGIGRYTQSPALIVCQHCQATVTTTMEYETGLLTWAVAGGLCLVGCVFGCCLIPFCIDATKDIEHRCANCNKVVGRFRHFS